MNMVDLKDLCDTFGRSQLNELELTSATTRIRLRQHCQPVQNTPVLEELNLWPEEPLPVSPEAVVICSPGIGQLLLSHPSLPDKKTEVANYVSKGDTVAYLQVGLLLFPVISDVDGVIERLLAEPLKRVDFSAPLFSVRPTRNPVV